MTLSNHLLQKYINLKDIFTKMESVLIAYSGGVDSSLLLKVGRDTLKDKCIGIIGVSPSLASNEYSQAVKQTQDMGIELKTINTNEINNSLYVLNNNDRCYFCKSELFGELQNLSNELNINFIVEGSNIDDLNDHRPGMKAAAEMKIRSPLIEAKLNKKEIRQLAKFLGIKSWNKPSQPCLSSRVAYGVKINENILDKINQAENYLKKLDFKIVRVRYFEDHVSVEVGDNEISRLFTPKIQKSVSTEFGKIGFTNIVFDPEGYQSGKLNKIQIAS
jgi:pyridinium-3,5-biscarboxylic acid mononucleotide sulfurtransferase